MNKYEQLIDKLADKRCTFGCMFRDDEGRVIRYADEPLIPKNWVQLGHPIYIGDVLEKIRNMIQDEEIQQNYYHDLCYYWRPFGFTNSLQEIYEGTQVVEVCCECREESNPNCHKPDHNYTGFDYFLKDPNAEALFNYLINLDIV
jgi:hypothetical protein